MAPFRPRGPDVGLPPRPQGTPVAGGRHGVLRGLPPPRHHGGDALTQFREEPIHKPIQPHGRQFRRRCPMDIHPPCRSPPQPLHQLPHLLSWRRVERRVLSLPAPFRRAVSLPQAQLAAHGRALGGAENVVLRHSPMGRRQPIQRRVCPRGGVRYLRRRFTHSVAAGTCGRGYRHAPAVPRRDHLHLHRRQGMGAARECAPFPRGSLPAARF